ncbi:MAG: hypothetical protein NTZ93_02570 [Candidatus Beckwithbacteria bacterium]|nr:hypothetical protein [Candidatus Beckwithbacteria bacterium]
MVKPQAKSSLLIIICVAVIGGLMFWRLNPQSIPIKVITEPSPGPVLNLSANSSDGKIYLEMKQKKEANTITWTMTAKQGEETAKTIWWQTLPADTTISIPLNSVSPDNKYMFLKQTGPDKTRYIVLTTSGKPLGSGSQTVEFAELFELKHPEYIITEVTGWGGTNLIVFNTDKIAGVIGPSFWFDLSGKSFIQLSHRFD